MSLRTKFIITCCLLLLALGSTVFAAESTVQAYRSFVQQHTLTRAGDVRTIRPWMTVPYISRVYHVPETYLYHALHIVDTHPPRHTTLHALAMRSHRPVDDIIHTIQIAILTYRKQHLPIHFDNSFYNLSRRSSHKDETTTCMGTYSKGEGG